MKWLNGFLAVGAFTALYYFEKKRPLRQQVEPKIINMTRDLAIAATAGIAMRLLEKPTTDRLTALVEKKNFGLTKIFPLPEILQTFFSVVMLDYTLYLWHVLTHKVPLLWRFHQVHHADLDLTAATAIRFHFGEISISVLFRSAQVLLIGVSPRALKIWQNLLFASVFFHHSNLRLPRGFEEKLQNLIMTPRLHGIHHSIKSDEMNSNWSSGLTIWDFLHKTFRSDVTQDEIAIGVQEFRRIEQITLPKMLVTPFESAR